MSNRYTTGMDLQVHVLDPAKDYLRTLDRGERGRIYSDIETLRRGNFTKVHTKQLKGEIRELIRGRHRISYFKFGSTFYFVRGFPKKSTKTPKKEIDYAEHILQVIQRYEK